MQIPPGLEQIFQSILRERAAGDPSAKQLQPNFDKAIQSASTEGGTRLISELLTSLLGSDESIQGFREALMSGKCASEVIRQLERFAGQETGKTGELLITETTLDSREEIVRKLVSSSGEARAVLEELQASLEGAGEGTSASPQLKCLERVLSRYVLSVQEGGVEGKEASGALGKLAEILKSLPRCSQALLEQGERALRSVLNGQFEFLRTAEAVAAVDFAHLFSDNPLHGLLGTLEKALGRVDPSGGEMERRLFEFVGQLRGDLQKLLQQAGPGDGTDVKNILEAACETIKNDFQANTSSPSVQQESLPRVAEVLLKSIQSQVSTLLSLPDDVLGKLLLELKTGETVTSENPFSQLRDLLKLVKNLDLSKFSFSPGLSETLSALDSEIVHSANTSVPAEVRVMLARAFSELENAARTISTLPPPEELPGAIMPDVEGLPGNTIAAAIREWGEGAELQNLRDRPGVMRPYHPGAVLPEAPPAGMLPTRSEKNQLVSILKSMEQQIQKILESMPVNEPQAAVDSPVHRDVYLSAEAARSSLELQDQIPREMLAYQELELTQLRPQTVQHVLEQRAILLKDPTVILLLKSLKGFDWGSVGTGNTAEKHFAEFLKELASKVTTTGGARAPLEPREIEKSLAKLEQQFMSEQTKASDRQKDPARNMLATIEQYVRGQEMLERLNPLMNLAGEPAFLLFPVILNGFATQLELLLYPEESENPDLENDEDNRGRKKNRYKRLEFEMSFEGLGRVQSRVWFRQGELLLDVTTENDSICAFLEERMPRFEAIMRAAGYSRTQCRLSSVPFAEMTPPWVRAVLGVDKRSV